LENESHGKSTFLERIIGLAIFAGTKDICTRCPIRVHLRGASSTITKVSVLETFQLDTNNKNLVRESPPLPP